MSKEEKRFYDSRKARVNQEASDWVAKSDRGFTAPEQDAFFDWLAESPLHSEAFNRREVVWRDMNVLADWRPEHGAEPNPDLLAVSRRRSKLIWLSVLGGVAALLATGLFVGSLLESSKASERILLASGENAQFYEHHVLEDGSKVELNRGAQVSVRFRDDKRVIDLLAGEAHFTVAKDETRPFVVRARGTVVQAVGTAFNVLLDSEEVEVIVTEGRVLVNPSIATTRESIVVETEPLVRKLNAGQRSVLSLNSRIAPPVIEEIAPEAMERRLAWKNEMLEFTDTPLSDVILEFNRRNHTQLVIGDISLAELPVTAAFRPNRLDEFVELLALIGNVEAERDGLSKIVLRKGDD